MSGWRLPRYLLLPLFLPWLLVSGPAYGQSDQALAKKYFQLGKELYERAVYEGALEQFQQSYRYSKKPALLYNIARCYEAMGELDKAIAKYQEFVATKPPNAPIIQARIKNLKRRMGAQKPEPEPKPKPKPELEPQPEPAEAAREPTAERPETEPEPQPVPKPDTTVSRRPAKPTTVAPSESPRVNRRAGRGSRIAGWSLVSAGGASLVVGIVAGVLANRRANDLEERVAQNTDGWDTMRDDYEGGEAMELTQIITLSVGGAAVVTGAVLLYMGYTAEDTDERRVWIAPSLTSGGAVVSGGLRF
jgi:hypothetical protein